MIRMKLFPDTLKDSLLALSLLYKSISISTHKLNCKMNTIFFKSCLLLGSISSKKFPKGDIMLVMSENKENMVMDKV